MNVLFAVWEIDPLFKFGGLGDIARSLPAALKQLGVDIRLIMPYYKVIKLGRIRKKRIGELKLSYNNKKEKIEIFELIHPTNQTIVYLLRNSRHFNLVVGVDTFALFDLTVVELLKRDFLHWTPDIIHCNDHHTGFIPLLAKERKLKVKTLLTIHNLSYHGRASIDVVDKLGLSKTKCQVVDWEIKAKKINFLLEGIVHADIVNTVSPTYAKEIMTEEQGFGLEEVLSGKAGRVFGILNGIDIDFRNFWHDKSVRYPYTKNSIESDPNRKVYSLFEGKKLNKIYLQRRIGLRVDDKMPLLSFIGRFDARQKGMDILHKMLRRIDTEKYEFVILGTGDKDWEERFQWLAKFYPKNVSCNFRFDEALAHQIYAGADFILIPSKFEPCGLIQMIAMMFGTIPIARKTGGLSDSIDDGKNGFLFEKNSSEALEKTVNKALNIWNNDKEKYKILVEKAMGTDFSWKTSAKRYFELYEKLVEGEL